MRTLWVALFALGLIWQPVLLLASDIHAATHLLETGHADHDDHNAGTVIYTKQSPSPEGADTWHGLLHLAHCCGHATALPTEGGEVVAVRRLPVLTAAPPGTLATLTLTQPLRPPIRS